MGSRLRKTSPTLSSLILPTVSAIRARRTSRFCALKRMASAMAGQYFSWSGVSCKTDLTIANPLVRQFG